MLHGEVLINNVVLGEWSANNVGKTDGFANYECHIKYRDLQGYPCEAQWTLRGHGESNGAISLAARVLNEGMMRAKRTTPNGSI